jgi:hypothetical protein
MAWNKVSMDTIKNCWNHTQIFSLRNNSFQKLSDNITNNVFKNDKVSDDLVTN